MIQAPHFPKADDDDHDDDDDDDEDDDTMLSLVQHNTECVQRMAAAMMETSQRMLQSIAHVSGCRRREVEGGCG